MARGQTGTDPDKGKPHRHTRAKIMLLLSDPALTAGQLAQVLGKVAETRPEEVLDAVLAVLEEQAPADVPS